MTIAQDITAAFKAGDIDRVNALVGQYGVSESQAASLFNLSPADLASVKNAGVGFYTPPEDPIIVAPPPAAKVSAPTSGRVLEDTDETPIEKQIASAPIQYSYSEVDKKNPAIVREISYLTGEVLDTHVLAGGGSQGLAKAAMPVVGMALNFIVPGAGAIIGNALGVSATTGAAIMQAGLQVAGGSSLEDAIKGVALSQVGAAGTSAFNSAVGELTNNQFVNNVVNNVANNVITGVIAGKDASQIATGVLGSVVSTTVTAQTGNSALGATAATLVTTGGNTKAALNTLVNSAGSSLNQTDANNIVTQLQKSGLVDTNTTNNIQNQLDQMLTIDASGAKDISAAAAFATDSGYNKFTFDGKTYTLDNNNAANTIAQLESDAAKTNAANLAATTKANLAGGEFDGVDAAVARNLASNNTTIGNAEADTPEEAAYLAKQRNPTGTTFTFGGRTYTMGTSNAAVTGALNETQTAATKDNIKNSATFNDAFALARKDLPAGSTFEWFNPKTGKTESFVNATKEERPDLNITAADKIIDALNASNLATKTNASSTVAAQNDTLARIIGSGPNESSAETNRLRIKNDELDLANATQKANATKAAINSLLGEGTASNIVIQGLSNLNQAVGQTIDFVGGTGAALGITGANNALTNAGRSVTRTGESLQLESVNQANKNVIDAIAKADGVGAKVWEGAKAIIKNPLSANMAAIELIQEALPLGLAAKVYKLAGKFAAIGVDMALNAMESGGAAYNDKYRAAISAGKTPEQADAEATKSFYVAAGVTAATAGVVDSALIGKITGAVEKAATKVGTSTAKETGSEFTEEFLTSALTDLALTGKVDLNKALTQGVVGGFVAGKTTATIDSANNINDKVSDVQNTFTQELNNSGITSSNKTGQINSFVDSSTGQPIIQTDVAGTLTSSGLTETAQPTSFGELAAKQAIETGNVGADTNTGVVLATDTTAGTALVLDSSGKAQVVSLTGSSTPGSQVNLKTDANGTVTATTGANTAANASTAATSFANAAANANAATNAAVNANANANQNANPNVNPNANVNTNPNANPNANANQNANPNVNPNANVSPNVNTNVTPNVNPDVNVVSPEVINVGGVNIPGTYIPDSVFKPITQTTPTGTTPDTKTPVTKTPTKKTSQPTQMPTTGGGGAAVAAPLANVFYYGKDFGGQKQQVAPTGDLMMSPYHELSVTKAGAEAPLPAIPVAQAPKESENDISALLQQIMSSGDRNMTQEELMQIIQARG